MSVTLDSAASASTNGAAGSLTKSFTNNASSNSALVVSVLCPNTSDLMATGTVTYNSVSMGAAVVTNNILSNLIVRTYVMVNPPTGMHDVIVTPSANAYLDVIISSWNGVNQSNPVEITAKAGYGFATSPYPNPGSLTGVSATSMVVDSFAVRDLTSSPAPSSGQTALTASTNDTNSTFRGSYLLGASAMSWTFTGTNKTVAHTVIALAAAAASIDGTVSITDAADTVAGSVTVSGGSASGIASIVEAIDTVVGSGTSASTGVNASITITEVLDTVIGSGSVAGSGYPSITSDPLVNNTGTVLGNISNITALVYNQSTGALVVKVSGLTSNANGVVSIISSFLVSGTYYAVEFDLTASSAGNLGRLLPVFGAI